MKIKITYPQIVIECKEIEVSEEAFEQIKSHSNDSEQAQFIWDNISEMEQNHVPLGMDGLTSAIDNGYCGIFKCKVKRKKS